MLVAIPGVSSHSAVDLTPATIVVRDKGITIDPLVALIHGTSNDNHNNYESWKLDHKGFGALCSAGPIKNEGLKSL